MPSEFANNAASTAYATSLVVKASPGRLLGFTVHNSKASAQFIQLHNTISLPADAQVPVWVVLIPASTSAAFDWGEIGRWCTVGITLCNSSTGPTKTVGSADCWFEAQYR